MGNDPKVGNSSLTRTRSVENLTNALGAVHLTADSHLHLHRASSESNIALNTLAPEVTASNSTANNPVDTVLSGIVPSSGFGGTMEESTSDSSFAQGSSPRVNTPAALIMSISLPEDSGLLGQGNGQQSGSGSEEEDADESGSENSPNASQSAPHLITVLTLRRSTTTSLSSNGEQ